MHFFRGVSKYSMCATFILIQDELMDVSCYKKFNKLLRNSKFLKFPSVLQLLVIVMYFYLKSMYLKIVYFKMFIQKRDLLYGSVF